MAHEWGTAPEFVGPRHELRERILLERLLAATPASAVLNVGAGQGSFTLRLRELGFEVTSTDLSSAAVEVLRERTGAAVQADATRLPFEAEAFDAVVMGEVLEHIERDGAAVAEAARVLRPGGVLAVSVPRNPAWFSRSDEWAGHVRRYTRERLRQPIEVAGLDVLECVGWGFPISALYHRTVFEWAIRRDYPRQGLSARPTRTLALLSILLRVDRAFVGTQRGALGYIATARKPV